MPVPALALCKLLPADRLDPIFNNKNVTFGGVARATGWVAGTSNLLGHDKIWRG
jgi:hypothetical protein